MEALFENCTLYWQGGFGYGSAKVKWVKIRIGQYAQYPAAVHIEYLEKGKRKPRGFVQTYKPSLVIAEGHDNPEPPSFLGDYKAEGDGVMVAQSRAAAAAGRTTLRLRLCLSSMCWPASADTIRWGRFPFPDKSRALTRAAQCHYLRRGKLPRQSKRFSQRERV
jgi:hypothetical protein